MAQVAHQRERLERQLRHNHSSVVVVQVAHEGYHTKSNKEGRTHSRSHQLLVILFVQILILRELAGLCLIFFLRVLHVLLVLLLVYLLLQLGDILDEILV